MPHPVEYSFAIAQREWYLAYLVIFGENNIASRKNPFLPLLCPKKNEVHPKFHSVGRMGRVIPCNGRERTQTLNPIPRIVICGEDRNSVHSQDEDESNSQDPFSDERSGETRVEENRLLSVPSPYSEAAATGVHDDQLEYGRRESLISTSMVCSRRQSGEGRE